MSTRAFVLLAFAVGCAPTALRVPPPDAGGPGREPDAGADGPSADGGDATLEAPQPARCFPAPSHSGADQPGDFCTTPDQCQHGPDELVACTPHDMTEEIQKIAHCHRYARAALGQPCAVTLTTGGSPDGAFAAGSIDETGYCDLGDGLVCDRTSGRCVARPQLGEFCASAPYCARGAFCDGTKCVPGRAVGERCMPVLDFMEQSQCATTAHCDVPSETCVPRVADRDACESDAACASGVCLNGACAPAGTCPSGTVPR